jgi:hypothetical protein
MTIINGIEIDNIKYIPNNIKQSLKKNKCIEDKLNVIIVISNCSQFATRYRLAKEFIERIKNEEEYVNLYIVELAYYDQDYQITDDNNKNHLQLKSNFPLWHKESMINIAVKQLLPKDWKAFAYIDADIEFDNIHWAMDTLKLLQSYDIVQLFSHAIDMNKYQYTMKMYSGFGYSYSNGKKYISDGNSPDYWHPGYCWAMTRSFYEKIGSLLECGILGSGDFYMALALIQKNDKINRDYSKGYRNAIIDFQTRAEGVKMGYTPGVIKHHYHGTKANRKYNERWKLLVKYEYDPDVHLTKNKDGLIIPTEDMPKELLNEIIEYFNQRLEDN